MRRYRKSPLLDDPHREFIRDDILPCGASGDGVQDLQIVASPKRISARKGELESLAHVHLDHVALARGDRLQTCGAAKVHRIANIRQHLPRKFTTEGKLIVPMSALASGLQKREVLGPHVLEMPSLPALKAEAVGLKRTTN